MAERYETKAPVRFTRDGTVTLQQDQRAIYEEMSSKKDPQQTEESTYTNLQLREKQPTSSSSSSSSSNGGAQVGVVRGKTSTKVIVAVAIVFTACVILVAFALIMAGMTLSSSQETSKDSTRSSALIESLESQLTQLQGDLQDSTQQSTRSSALIESLNGQVTELRQELSSMRSTLAVAQHSFNTSLHILLHPYQNCYTDTTERRMTSTTTTYYTRRVATNYLNINVTVTGYYTLDIRCHYQISNGGYTVVTQLHQSSSGMRCICAVSYPSTTTDALRPLSVTSDFYLDCILSITRCPLIQTIV